MRNPDKLRKIKNARELFVTKRATKTILRISRGFLVRTRIARLRRATKYI